MNISNLEYNVKSGALSLAIGIGAFLSPSCSRTAQDSQPDNPNIVFILVDDMGIECLPSYGGKSHPTPNIDKLATQGMRFTSCFSNPFCSPSRASLLTGRYPFKNGLELVLWNIRQENTYLSPDQPSFARQLQEAGYATAIAGKWHTSLLHKHNTINDFGFDQYMVWQIFDDEGNKRNRFWNPHLNHNGTLITDQIADRYGPDVYLEFYLDFIKQNAEKEQPFLAYFSTNLPHFPWEPTPDSEDQRYRKLHSEHKGDPKYFPDMMKYMDKLVGKIMQELDDLGIADNTALIFLSDNGTDQELYNIWGDGITIQGGKGTMTDRGTHVPLIVRWPGHIEEGTVCDDLIDFSDFLPTLCDLAGAPLPDDMIHGQSFFPQLFGEQGTPREWVHVQNVRSRHLRSKDYILNNENELRPVVNTWESPATPNQNKDPEKERAAREKLQSAFDALGE